MSAQPMCILWIKGAGSMMTVFMNLLAYSPSHQIVALHCEENDGDVIDWEPVLRRRMTTATCMRIPGSFAAQRGQVLRSWRPAVEIVGLDVTEQSRALEYRQTSLILGVDTELECPLIDAGKPYAWVQKKLPEHSIALTPRMLARVYRPEAA